MGAKPKTRAGTERPSEQVDHRLADRARKKLATSKVPSKEERAALRRVDSAASAIDRKQLYQRMPRAEYLEISGLPRREAEKLHDRDSVPLRGRNIDLGKVLAKLHSMIANGKATSVDHAQDYQRERAELMKLQRLEKEGALVDPVVLQAGLLRMTGLLRKAIGAVQKRFGAGAATILDAAIDESEREVARMFEVVSKKGRR